MSKTEAQSKLNKLRGKLSANGDLPTGNETVASWMTYWIDNISQTRPSTREGYRSSIRYIIAATGKVRLSKLTPQDVRKVETYIVTTKKLSTTTAHGAYQVFAKALKDAEREGRILRNVARSIDAPRKAVPKLTVLSADEGIAVIRSVTEARLGSRVAAALLTGARQGELIGLEIDRVDFDENTIDLSWQLQRISWRHGPGCAKVGTYVDTAGQVRDSHACGRKRGTDCPTRTIAAPADWEHRRITGALYWSRPKTKAGWRVIPLVEPLRSILARRIAVALTEPNPHGLVWTADPKGMQGGAKGHRGTHPLDGSPLDPSRDNVAWHKVLAEAKVTDVRLHDARHTAVTLLYDLGVSETVIQDIVGQSAISATRGYRHKSRKQSQEALEALGKVLAGKMEELVA